MLSCERTRGTNLKIYFTLIFVILAALYLGLPKIQNVLNTDHDSDVLNSDIESTQNERPTSSETIYSEKSCKTPTVLPQIDSRLSSTPLIDTTVTESKQADSPPSRDQDTDDLQSKLVQEIFVELKEMQDARMKIMSEITLSHSPPSHTYTQSFSDLSSSIQPNCDILTHSPSSNRNLASNSPPSDIPSYSGKTSSNRTPNIDVLNHFSSNSNRLSFSPPNHTISNPSQHNDPIEDTLTDSKATDVEITVEDARKIYNDKISKSKFFPGSYVIERTYIPSFNHVATLSYHEENAAINTASIIIKDSYQNREGNRGNVLLTVTAPDSTRLYERTREINSANNGAGIWHPPRVLSSKSSKKFSDRVDFHIDHLKRECQPELQVSKSQWRSSRKVNKKKEKKKRIGNRRKKTRGGRKNGKFSLR